MRRPTARRLLGIAVPLLLISVVVVRMFSGGGEGRLVDAEGRRLFVADGDTLRIGDETIRLADLDAVERGQFCLDAAGASWSCGESARAALTALVAPGGLSCTTIERDRYGRTVARCKGTDGGDVARAMVTAGWAMADDPRYAAEQKAARGAKRGIWAGTFEVPSVWRERNRVMPKTIHG
jgi:endonuclease YncB( thermonuclease family)